MKLLLINYEYPPVGGGAATACAALAGALAKLGHAVTVLTAAPPAGVAVDDPAGVRVVRLWCGRRRVEGGSLVGMAFWLLRAALALPALLRRQRPQAAVVYFSLPCGPLGLLARRLAGIPYLLSLRGSDIPGNDRRLDRFHRWLAPVRRAALRGASAVIANSPGARAMAEAADGVAVACVPNGVDTEMFRVVDFPAGPLSVLFVGRLHAQKNVALLLRALGRLDDVAWRLVVVGDGPQRDALRRQARDLGIDDRIDWRGWCPREQLPVLYGGAHVLVNPSCCEGMPNAVLEAMACGRPVIASDVPGNRDLVQPVITGFLHALDDADALAAALRDLAADPGLVSRLGAAGRRQVEAGYTWGAVTRAYLDCLGVNE